MTTKSLGCQALIKSCCRHPFKPRNPELCSLQNTWLEAKENHENLPQKSFNHSYEACKKSDSNLKYLFFYIKNTPGTQPMSTGDRLKKCFVYVCVRQPRTSCVCWRTHTAVLCVLNRQPTWAKITHGQPKSPEKPKIQKLIFLKKVLWKETSKICQQRV